MLKKVKKNKYLLPFCLLIALVSSCDANRVFDDYVAIPNSTWKKDNAIKFSFSIQDTTSKRNLFINLRNNNNYEFSNLFLITQLDFPNQQKIIDTLEYDMADATGKFLGAGFSEIKENKLFYKENITFPIQGEYTIKVLQAMRKSNEVDGINSLNGITDVGFRIEKIE